MNGTDVAVLGLEVRSQQVKAANDELRKMPAAASAAERAAKTWGTSASSAAAKVANDNARAEKSVSGLAGAYNKLRAILGTVAAFMAANAITRMTDAWTDLNSRLVIATGSAEAGVAVMGRLQDMARRTYSSLELTAESYLLNSTALKELGYSTKTQLDFTEALNNALVVSGAKAERAATVQNALSKAMALGELRGDELNTVIQSGGRVASALAQALGVATNDLRKMGKEGKLTSDVILKALVSQLGTLRKEADSMPATIGDSIVLFKNAFLGYLGSMDSATGASAAMAQGIIYLGDNLETLGKIASVVGVAMLAAFGPNLVFMVGTALVGAFRMLTVAIASNPIGAIAVALVTVIAAVWQFRDAISKAIGTDLSAIFKTAANNVIGAFVGAHEVLKIVWAKFPQLIGGAFIGAINLVREGINTMISNAKEGINVVIGLANKIPGVNIGKLDAATPTIGKLENPYAADNAATMADIKSKMGAALSADYVGDGFKSATVSANELSDATDRVINRRRELSKEEKKSAEGYAKLVSGANQFIETQERERNSIGLTEQAAARLRYEQELFNKAANDNIRLSPQQAEQLRNLAAGMAEAEARTSSLKAAFDFAKDTFKGFASDLKQGLQSGKGFWESFGTAAMNALNKIADKLMDMAINDLFGAAFKGASGGGGGFFSGIAKLFGFARGGVPGGAGVSAYSSQIVTKPTVFPMAKGLGLMGEAGPEAVMPLRRAPDGRLGVQVVGGGNGAGSAQRLTVHVSLDNELLRAIVKDESGAIVAEASPQIVGIAVTQSHKQMSRSQREGGGEYRAA